MEGARLLEYIHITHTHSPSLLSYLQNNLLKVRGQMGNKLMQLYSVYTSGPQEWGCHSYTYGQPRPGKPQKLTQKGEADTNRENQSFCGPTEC